MPLLAPAQIRTRRRVLLGLGVWLLAAVGVGAAGLLRGASPGLLAAIAGAIALGAGLTVGLIPSLRAWAVRVDLRAFVLVHVLRFGVAGLMIMAANDQLPRIYSAASEGGLYVAASALILVATFMPVELKLQAWLVGAWNAFGLYDLGRMAVGLARSGLENPEVLAPLGTMPVVLLTLFFFPLFLATHLLIFVRLVLFYRALPR